MNIEKLTTFFIELRKNRFNIGLNELFDAAALFHRHAETGTWDDFKEQLSLLWCNNRHQKIQFEVFYIQTFFLDGMARQSTNKVIENVQQLENVDELETQKPQPGQPSNVSLKKLRKLLQDEGYSLNTFPFSVLDAGSSADHSGEGLYSYTPLSRRNMIYSWKYLRKWGFEGARDILDIDSTLKDIASKGFFSQVFYKRKKINLAKLILLVDRNGSMTPFHRYINDIVDSAFSEGGLGEVRTCYFHNVFSEFVYLDPNLTDKILVSSIFQQMDEFTSVLFLSDAGAARGNLSFQRIRRTLQAVKNVKKRTSLAAWVNPMPGERWKITSAAIISRFIPMFQMDADGFSNAIDVVRGVK